VGTDIEGRLAELEASENSLRTVPRQSSPWAQRAVALARQYADLERVAGSLQRDQSPRAAHALRIERVARAGALRLYSWLDQYHPTADGFDYGLIYLARRNLTDGNVRLARRLLYDLIRRFPRSKFVPDAYLAFGELFYAEAHTEPSAWSLAEKAYIEVTKYPPPANRMYAYARYKLAYVYINTGDYRRALSELKRVVSLDAGDLTSRDGTPLSNSAQDAFVSVFAAIGVPRRAREFFQSAVGGGDDADERTRGLLTKLARVYITRRQREEAALICSELNASGISESEPCTSVSGSEFVANTTRPQPSYSQPTLKSLQHEWGERVTARAARLSSLEKLAEQIIESAERLDAEGELDSTFAALTIPDFVLRHAPKPIRSALDVREAFALTIDEQRKELEAVQALPPTLCIDEHTGEFKNTPQCAKPLRDRCSPFALRRSGIEFPRLTEDLELEYESIEHADRYFELTTFPQEAEDKLWNFQLCSVAAYGGAALAASSVGLPSAEAVRRITPTGFPSDFRTECPELRRLLDAQRSIQHALRTLPDDATSSGRTLKDWDARLTRHFDACRRVLEQCTPVRFRQDIPILSYITVDCMVRDVTADDVKDDIRAMSTQAEKLDHSSLADTLGLCADARSKGWWWQYKAPSDRGCTPSRRPR
jgi:tetratricopeptide (TPR) repeat protein